MFDKRRKAPESSGVTTISIIQLNRCSFTNLFDIVIDESIHIGNLSVSSNKIESLVDAPDFVQHLEGINLANLPLKELSPKFLEKLENIQWLTLANDEKTSSFKIEPNMFAPLKNLKVLYFQSDKNELNPEWFTGLTKLTSLNFGAERLASFDYMGLVNTLPALKELNIYAENDLKCDFLRKMVEDLKAANRFEIMEKNYKVVGEGDHKLLENGFKVGDLSIYYVNCGKPVTH